MSDEFINNHRNVREDLRKFHKLQIEASNNGIKLGDFIEKLIKYFKLDLLVDKNCLGCEARKQALNSLRLNGWKIEWDKFKEL